jgi:predicted PurR-regulated permease PerM
MATAEAPIRSSSSGIRTALALLGIAFALYFLYLVRRVLLALILAVFFAYLIAPIVFFVERLVRGSRVVTAVGRGLSVAVVYASAVVVLAVASFVVMPKLSEQAGGFLQQVPEYSTAIRSWGERWTEYERVQLPPDLRTRVDQAIVAGTETAAIQVREVVISTLGVFAFLPWLVLIPVLSFFFLKDLDALRYYAVHALPADFRGPGYRLAIELNTALASYVRSQLLACLIVGVTCWIGFAVLRVPYAVLLGLLAGVLEFIPLVGPFVVLVMTTIVAAVHSPMQAVWVVVFLVALRVVEDYVIYPRLMGRGTHLHPLVIIIAVLIGVELGGIVGVFLAVPAISTLVVAYHHWIDWRQSAERAAAGVVLTKP